MHICVNLYLPPQHRYPLNVCHLNCGPYNSSIATTSKLPYMQTLSLRPHHWWRICVLTRYARNFAFWFKIAKQLREWILVHTLKLGILAMSVNTVGINNISLWRYRSINQNSASKTLSTLQAPNNAGSAIIALLKLANFNWILTATCNRQGNKSQFCMDFRSIKCEW